jgi:diadenosine tetraphosphate (Ap4A) HIT family hydrolase
MAPGIYLITLTGPHSGDLETDRRVLGEAWRALSKIANAERWWSAYAMTWEATPGQNGEGHLHMHVAALSSWVPYEDLHTAWRSVMPGALVLDVQAPKQGRKAVGRAANYLAKYVTKGIEPVEFTGRKAGELLVAMRGRRKVTTSARFWLPVACVCRKCNQERTLSQSPPGLQDVMPAAVLRARAERHRWRGWKLARGAPQVEVRWPS